MAEARVDTHVDTIVRGGKVVTSSQVMDAAVAIKGEKIAAVGPEHLLPPADRYIDAEGMFVHRSNLSRKNLRNPTMLFKVATEPQWTHGPTRSDRRKIIGNNENTLHDTLPKGLL